MNEILKKLNFKSQKNLVVVNAPQDLNKLWEDFSTEIFVDKTLNAKSIEFALIFCTRLEEIQKYGALVHEKLIDDGLLWFVYPKGTSKKYKCEFNRDTGWKALGELELEPVRMVAIDSDWSALRFRNVKNIKTMTRNTSMILSKEGMAKTKSK